jgi:ketosteroid isomerase-like protein
MSYSVRLMASPKAGARRVIAWSRCTKPAICRAALMVILTTCPVLTLGQSANSAQAPIAIRQAKNPSEPVSDDGLQKALTNFIQAFDNLDWERFRAAFADDATVFYPRAYPTRVEGRAEYEKIFRLVFEQIRMGKSAPPYMDIQPRDLKIQRFDDVAIVTFHLDDRPRVLNRRTIVLKKTDHGWKIVHLHASEVELHEKH